MKESALNDDLKLILANYAKKLDMSETEVLERILTSWLTRKHIETVFEKRRKPRLDDVLDYAEFTSPHTGVDLIHELKKEYAGEIASAKVNRVFEDALNEELQKVLALKVTAKMSDVPWFVEGIDRAVAGGAIDDAQAEKMKNLILTVTVGELYYGARRSGRVKANMERVDEFAAESMVLSCDVETAKRYGEIKAQLRKRGRPIPENDIWVAALALQHDLTLVSRDEHFGQVQSLRAEAW